MKNTIKTLTLSVEEILQLIDITDADSRRQVAQSLIGCSDIPSDDIDETAYSDQHPMALCLAKKVQRKVKSAHRRKQRMMEKKQSSPTKETTNRTEYNSSTTAKPTPDEAICLELNEATVGRLLWLKQNHKTWCKALNCIVEAMMGSLYPKDLHSDILSLLKQLFSIVNPLINQAADYHLTPKRLRQRFAFA